MAKVGKKPQVAEHGTTIDAGKGQDYTWQCTCGAIHVLPTYVLAHWGEELVHTCDCKVIRSVLQGMITTPSKSEEGE